MTDRLEALNAERASRARDLDILEKKYWNTKGVFEAKEKEISDLKETV